MGDVDLALISTHSETENRMDEITQGEDQGRKLGNTYLKGRWRNEKRVKEAEKVTQEVGGEQEMNCITDRVGCQQCQMPKRGKVE